MIVSNSPYISYFRFEKKTLLYGVLATTKEQQISNMLTFA